MPLGFLQMLALALCLTLSPLAQAVSSSGLPACLPRSGPPGVGLTLTGQTALDARTTDLAFHSTAMQATEHAAVMLPVGYNPAHSYPTLYLLAGAVGSDTDWFSQSEGNAEALVGNLPIITVMIDSGVSGDYSDWFGQLAVLGQTTPTPSWETFHIDELIPWIDAHYPTIASASGRALAGLSMGGFGAMKYAFAHPDVFGAAGSFSGSVDPEIDWPEEPVFLEALWSLSLLPQYGPPAYCTWGDPILQHNVWKANDPVAQVARLKGVQVFIAVGNGTPGPMDNASDPNLVAESTFETSMQAQGQALSDALDKAGIPHTDDFYGVGTHTWPYWRADLTTFLSWLPTHLPAFPT